MPPPGMQHAVDGLRAIAAATVTSWIGLGWVIQSTMLSPVVADEQPIESLSRPGEFLEHAEAGPLFGETVTADEAGDTSGENADGDDQRGIFLPSDNASRLWEQTLATVAANHTIARAEPPDFDSLPPLPGVIESVWTEPDALGTWPPRRQRVIVRVVPAAGGAWVEGIVQTESLTGPPPEQETAANSLPLDVLDDVPRVGHWEPLELTAPGAGDPSQQFTTALASRMAPQSEMVASLPSPEETWLGPPGVPWAESRHPRLSRIWYKVGEDYRNFYSCESLTCLAAAFGTGALMANTGFDETIQNAWQQGVTPTGLGTFFSGCKDIGEGRYSIPIFGAAAVTGLLLEGRPVGDAVGMWGSRSLRILVVGAPPLYVLQLATGASRPGEGSAGSKWVAFNDNNGVSGHAFMGAVPFLAAAGMVEGPVAKGSLYVCSTFVAFSRMTDDAHYPSQSFLGWYLAFASAVAVDRTEMHFAGMEVEVVPVPLYGGGSGVGFTTRW